MFGEHVLFVIRVSQKLARDC